MVSGVVTRASDSTIIVNASKNGPPLVASPGPSQGAGLSQLQYEQQRAKQISSGSEKRLKLQQQR